MYTYKEFILEQKILDEINVLLECYSESSTLNEAIFKGAKIKKTLREWGDAKMDLIKVDYTTKKKMQDPNADKNVDAKIKEAGDKKKSALNDKIRACDDELDTLATTDRLKTKVSLGKAKYDKLTADAKLKFAEELGDNAAADAAEEQAKEAAKKAKELEAKNKELDDANKIKDEINAKKVEVEQLKKKVDEEQDEQKKHKLNVEYIQKQIEQKELEAKNALQNNQDASSIKDEIVNLKDQLNRTQKSSEEDLEKLKTQIEDAEQKTKEAYEKMNKNNIPTDEDKLVWKEAKLKELTLLKQKFKIEGDDTKAAQKEDEIKVVKEDIEKLKGYIKDYKEKEAKKAADQNQNQNQQANQNQ